ARGASKAELSFSSRCRTADLGVAQGARAVQAYSSRHLSAAESRRRRSLLADWRRNWVLLALILPGLVYFWLFYYIPLFGYVIAFQNYLPFLGFFGSRWVGFDNFANLFADGDFWAAIRNTLLFAFLQLVLYFPVPIALALLLNSLISSRLRRFV